MKMSVQSSAVVKIAIRMLEIIRREIETHTASTSLSHATCSLVCTSQDHIGRTACVEKGRENSQRNETGLYEKVLNINTLFWARTEMTGRL